jgi:hypothetical protein
MAKVQHHYGEVESKILIQMYENPEESFDTFSLTQRTSGITVVSPEFVGKFKETIKATEQLIVKGLVDGKQLKHHDLGVYFTDMKFKFKGKQEAIQERDKAEEFKKKLPEFIAESNKVIEEMKQYEEKQKK